MADLWFQKLLKERAKLLKQLNQLDKFIIAYADWLDWLANQQRVDDLELELAHLRTIAASQQINRGQHFELVEGLEPYVALVPKLRSSLANEYQGIAIESAPAVSSSHWRSESVLDFALVNS